MNIICDQQVTHQKKYSRDDKFQQKKQKKLNKLNKQLLSLQKQINTLENQSCSSYQQNLNSLDKQKNKQQISNKDSIQSEKQCYLNESMSFKNINITKTQLEQNDGQNIQKTAKDKFVFRFKCFRYLKEMISKYHYTKPMAYAVVRSCKNYKQFKKKLNKIRDLYRNNNDELMQTQDICPKQINPDSNLYQFEKNNINQQQYNILGENSNFEKINTESDTFNFNNELEEDYEMQEIEKNMFIDQDDIIKEITIDPLILIDETKTQEEICQYIEGKVNIPNFKLQEDNFKIMKKSSQSYFNTKKNKQEKQKKIKKSKKDQAWEIEKQRRMEEFKKKQDEFKHLKPEYQKFPWGHAKITKETLQVQGDITNQNLWRDTLQIQMQMTGNKKYRNIIMDPAWPDTGCSLGYKTLDDKQWINSIKPQQLQNFGFMGVWVSNQKIPIGIDYLLDNEYKFVEQVIWIKINKYLVVQTKVGFYLLHSVEYCLIGLKKPPNMKISSFVSQCQSSNLIFEKARLISQKPDELYELFEKMNYGGPNLEIFGRCHNARIGWTTIGDEAICYKDMKIEELEDYKLNQ